MYNENPNRGYLIKEDFISIEIEPIYLGLAGFILFIANSLFVPAILIIFLKIFTDDNDLIAVAATAFSGVICIAGLAFYLRNYLKAFFLQLTKSNTWMQILAFAILNFLISFLIGIILTLFNLKTDNANEVAVNDMVLAFPVLAFIAVVIVAPIIEEFIFRFFIFRAIKKYNSGLAFAVSILVFAALHFVSSLSEGSFMEDLPTLSIYLAMSTSLTISYFYTKKMSVPIMVHLINNLLSFLLLVVIKK